MQALALHLAIALVILCNRLVMSLCIAHF